MEPATEEDLQNRFIQHSPWSERFAHFMAPGFYQGQSVWNLRYAAALCRMKYYSSPYPVPTTAEDMSAMHKLWYNTAGGAANETRNVDCFRQAIAA